MLIALIESMSTLLFPILGHINREKLLKVIKWEVIVVKSPDRLFLPGI